MNELFLQPKKIISVLLLFFLIGIVSANVSVNFVTNSTYSTTNPATIQFNDTSVCDPACTNWAWDFNGDGIVDSLIQNTTYTFTYPGNYSPKLFVSNNYNTGTKTRLHYITIGPALVHPTVAPPASTWGAPYHNDTDGTSYSYKMDTRVDLQNSTYMKYWLQNFTATKNFSITDFSVSLMAPMMSVFGFWIFLIIWALYLLAVWIRSGDVTLPLVVGILSIGIFGLLFPKEALPVIIVMIVICGAIIITKLLKDQV